MISNVDYALMAGRSYQSTRDPGGINWFPIPQGWSPFFHVPDSNTPTFPTTDGFEAISFQNGNDIVISYAGTDPGDISGDVAADAVLIAGLVTSAQLLQAAEYYMQVKASNPNANITLTGHSLGGGLAALIAVFFNETAVTFDQAPFRNSANFIIATALRNDLANKFPASTYPQIATWLDPLDRFIWSFDPLGVGWSQDGLAAREAKVTNTSVQGEVASTSNSFKIGTELPPLTHGDYLHPVDLHSQALLTAFLQSTQAAASGSNPQQTLSEVTKKLTDLLGMIFDTKLFAYSTDPTNSKFENFLEHLVRHQAGNAPGVTTPDAMITRFTKDLWKLAQDGGLTLNDGSGLPTTYSNWNNVSKALTAFAMQMYYEDTANATNANKELFTAVTGGVQFDIFDVSKTFATDFTKNGKINLNDAKGYKEYFAKYLSDNPHAFFTPEERSFILAALPYLRDWYVQAGVVGMTVTDTNNRGAFMLGGNGNDGLAGGSGNDLLVGNAGDDTLKGGQGNDTLLGGAGADTYVYTTGDGTDNIYDSDGQGAIYADGAQLQGGAQYGDAKVHRDANHHLYVQADTNTLIIDGNLIVNNYTPSETAGALGLNMNGAVGDTAPTPTIVGDLAPIDFDLAQPGVQTQTDNLGNIIVNPAIPDIGRADALHGSTGNDIIAGKAGSDILDGKAGDDRLYADSPISIADAITNGNSQTGSGTTGDWLNGGAGEDTLVGSNANDMLTGGAGDDLLIGGAGNDALLGDNDTLPVNFPAQSWHYDPAANDIFLESYQYNTPSNPDDSGNDVLYAGAGNDAAFGGYGNDVIFGESGDDILQGNSGNDVLLGGTGKDTLYGDILENSASPAKPGNDWLDGGAEDDTLYGNEGDDTLIGGTGNDTMYGGTGRDTYIINQGDGIDHINDTQSDNNIIFGAGISAAVIKLREGSLLLDLGNGGQVHIDNFDTQDVFNSSAISRFEFADGTVLTSKELLARGFDLDGTSGNDSIVGTNTTDRINGFGGNDQLWGMGGNDQIHGGTGNDYLEGDLSTLSGQYHGNDYLDGEEGDDTIIGDGGDDTLVGGAGLDYLAGGEGADSYTLNLGEAMPAGNLYETIDDTAADANIVQFGTGIGEAGLRLGRNLTGDLQLDYSATDGVLITGGFNGAIREYRFANGAKLSWAQIIGRHYDQSLSTSTAASGAYIAGGTLGDIIQATGGSSVLSGGRGNDMLYGRGGNNTYLYDIGDGTDSINDIGGQTNASGATVPNRIKFGVGITQADIKLKLGALLIQVGTNPNDAIHIENFNQNDVYGTRSIDLFEFNDGTVLTYEQLLAKGFDLTGTDGNDTISGTNVTDRMQGGLGADQLFGGNGADVLDGGAGADWLEGGEGDDVLTGGSGDDNLQGGLGNDTYTFALGDGVDFLNDTEGVNRIEFGAGISADGITVSQSVAADGERYLDIDYGTGDRVSIRNGELGYIQEYRFAGNVVLTHAELLQRLSSINVAGTSGNDNVTGSAGADWLAGAGGNDSLNGGAGDDMLFGGEGDDVLSGGEGNDQLSGDGGNDTLNGGAGLDSYRLGFGMGSDTINETGTETSELRLDPGVNADSLEFRRDAGDLVLQFRNGTDGVRIKDYYANNQNWTVRAADGATQPLGDFLATFDRPPADSAQRAWADFMNKVTSNYYQKLVQNGYTIGNDGKGYRHDYSAPDMYSWYKTDHTAELTFVTTASNEAYIWAALGLGYQTLASSYESKTTTVRQALPGGDRLGMTNGTQADKPYFVWQNPMNPWGGVSIPFMSTVTPMVDPYGHFLGVWVYPATYSGTQMGYETRTITSVHSYQAYLEKTTVPEIVAGTTDNWIDVNQQGLVDGGAGNDTIRVINFDWANDQTGSLLYGNDGNDSLFGGTTADVLIGGAGDDFLDGGSGNDTYVVFNGDGVDVIRDSRYISSDGSPPDDTDVLVLPANLGVSDLVLSWGQVQIDGTYYEDFNHGNRRQGVAASMPVMAAMLDSSSVLLPGPAINRDHAQMMYTSLDISWGTSQKVRIVMPHGGDYSASTVEQFRLGDGTVLSLASLMAMMPPAPAFDLHQADNQLSGTGTAQSPLAGAQGNDTISGNGYLDGGDGNDVLQGGGGDDILRGGKGADSLFGGAGDDWLAPDAVEYWSDGNTYSGGAGNDRILGTRASDLYLFGEGDGRDVIGDFYHRLDTGSAGWDYYQDIHPDYGGSLAYYQWAGIPLDTNIWSDPGEPVYTGTDTLRFGEGIRPEDVAISIGDINNGGDLYFTLANGMDEVRFAGWSGRSSKPLGRVEFADGTVWSGDFLNTARNHIGGSDGVDPLSGTAGDDFLVGFGNSDNLSGYGGNDIIFGGAGADELYGGDGADTLRGGTGNDLLDGGGGADAMAGGKGDDTYVVDNVGDTVTENLTEGTDTVQSGITYTLGANVENLALTGTTAINGTGNELSNTLYGNSAANSLSGLDGNDTIYAGDGDSAWGGNGADTLVAQNTTSMAFLWAEAGNDTLYGGTGYTYLFGGAGNDTLYLGAGGGYALGGDWSGTNTGDDIIVGNTSNDYISGGDGNDNLTGGAGNDTLMGGAGDDTLYGGDGNDILTGGAGADIMAGGLGDDTYTITLTDTLTENANEGTDTVNTAATYTLGANLENITLTGTTAINGTGNELANVLTGNTASNILDGGLGADTLKGGKGDDTYVIDNLGDVITENLNEGTDTVQSSITCTLGANVENLTLTGIAAINGAGNELANVIRGNSAANTLTGGDGNDTLYAGNGDSAFGGNGDDTLIAENTVGNWAYLRGEGGNNILTGGAGSNQILGGINKDTITGGNSQNYIWADGFSSAGGDDIVNGGNGYDYIFAGAGNDYVAGNGGSDSIQGQAGNDVMQGGLGSDGIVDNAGNNLLDGGADADTLTGGVGNELFIGGSGNDTITNGTGADLIAFNRGDGLDTLNVSTVADNTLSLGGGIQLTDLAFHKDGNNLVLDTGASEGVVFKDWYVATTNHSFLNLQMIEEAAADFVAGGADPLRDNKIETFNFAGLADRFDQELAANPGLTTWALTNALTEFHLAGSDTDALGGDLAYQYGKNGNLANVGLTAAQSILSDPAFGTTAQVLKPLASLQEGVVRLG